MSALQQNEWRVIRNKRLLGKAWILQRGFWVQPHTRGAAKGLRRLFLVEYEEFYASKTSALRQMEWWLMMYADPEPAQSCKAFALCSNPATTTLDHPVLGSVPCCDRCKARLEAK